MRVRMCVMSKRTLTSSSDGSSTIMWSTDRLLCANNSEGKISAKECVCVCVIASEFLRLHGIVRNEYNVCLPGLGYLNRK